MKAEWGAAQKTLKDLVAQSGHELGVFRVDGLYQTGLGYTVRNVPCKRCGRVFTITFSPIDAFIVKPDDLLGSCNSFALSKAVSTKRRCCGHHCPVCDAPARPLDGFCKSPKCNCETDVPWRIKIGRIAHKCRGEEQHRFDVDTKSGQGLLDLMYRSQDGITHTVPVGTKVVWKVS
jgi:hypothetical protein